MNHHERGVAAAEYEKSEATEAREQLVAAVASELHDVWRSDRLQKDGSYEPREKQTTDAEWIEAHGTDTVDIANTSYDALPEDWKAENKEAAAFAVGLYEDLDGSGIEVDLSDPDIRSFVGDEIHKAWLARNEWAKDGALGVSFEELPLEEQEKDLNQFRVLQAVLGGEAENN